MECSPSAGTTFALGSSTVTCTATDFSGNSGSVAFTVHVVDTTPPELAVPADISVVTVDADGAPADDEEIAAFLGGATAIDIVDGAVPVTHDAPAVCPIGATVVTFSATDAAGNSATATAVVSVVGGQALVARALQDIEALDGEARAITEARRALEQALGPALWADELHLDGRRGDAAFNHIKQSITHLDRALAEGVDPAAMAVILQAKADLTLAARLLAETALDEARAAAGSGPGNVRAAERAIELGERELAVGDAAAEAGDEARAIDHYRNAWRHAVS